MVVNGKYNIKANNDLDRITLEEIRQAAAAGYNPTIIINGWYYTIAPEELENNAWIIIGDILIITLLDYFRYS